MKGILTTKLSVPYLKSDLIQRPRLMARCGYLEHHKVTLLIAPAGYGKTVLMRQFTETTNMPFVWYRLDAYDNDPKVFLQYLVTGLQVFFPGFSYDLLQLITENGGCIIRPLVIAFVNELERQATVGAVIVLDDYHLITDPIIHGLIQDILNNIPEGIHFIIASRTHLPLSLSALNLVGCSGVIDLEELIFTSEEIREFIADKKITKEALEEFESKVIGWPVILRLISDWAAVIAKELAYSDRVKIYDYLATEIFGQQSERVQQFLLTTSVLQEFTVEHCDKLRGKTDSWEILNMVERHYLSGIKVRDGKKMYRYHPLLQAYLQEHLGSSKKTLLRQAGHVYGVTGELERAIECFEKAGHPEDSIKVIKQASKQAFRQGQWQKVAGWLEALSGQWANDPWLALLRANISVNRGRMEEADYWLKKIILSVVNGEKSLSLIDHLLLLKARLLCCQGDYLGSLNTLTAFEGQRGEDPEIRFAVLLEQSLCLLLSGRFIEAEEVVKNSMETESDGLQPYERAQLNETLATVYYYQGNYQSALELYQSVILMVSNKLVPYSRAQAGIVRIYHAWGELEKAFEVALQNAKNQEALGLDVPLASTYSQLAILYSEREEWETAVDYFNLTFHHLGRNSGDLFQYTLTLMLFAETLCLRGNWSEALIKAKIALDYARKLGGVALASCEAIGALVIFRSGETELGQEMLLTATQNLEQLGYGKGLCYAYAFQAWVYLNEEKMVEAEEYTEKCLEIVAKLNFQQLFLGRYKMLLPLLKIGLECGIQVSFVQRILVRLGITALLVLIELAGHEDPKIRLRTVSPIAEIGGIQLKGVLERLTYDPDNQVRKLAIDRSKTSGLLEIIESPTSENRLQVTTFGSFRAFVLGSIERVITWRTTKTHDLLAYFLHHQEPVTKERIVEDLWYDVDQESASALFHTTLYYLRQSFEKVGCKDIILYRGKRYQLRPGSVVSDRQKFQDLVSVGLRRDTAPEQAVALLEEAAALYQGDYLAEMDYSWLIPYQENFKYAHAEARLQLARHYIEVREYLRAITHLKVAEMFDPLAEETHSLLMTAYAGMGNRLAVRNQYEKLQTVLLSELGLSPSPTTSNLYAKLVAMLATTVASPLASDFRL